MKTHSTIRGTILYTSKQSDRMDAERGREYFTLTRQTDGVTVLHAHCEIDDTPDVIRDVTSSFESRSLRPYDGTVRLSVGSRFEGTGWFNFTDQAAECVMKNHRDGRIFQTIKTDERPNWFGNHAIVNDGLLSRLFPLDAKPGKKTVAAMMSSPDHRGATGPMLFPMTFSIVYVQDETVTVGAGTFEARKFQITDTAGELPEEHPPYEMWCTKDEDGLFLRGGVGGYMQTHYELIELVFD